MRVRCPNCNAGGNISDEKIPPQGTNITCPKCKTTFTVKKPVAQAETGDAPDDYQAGVKLLKQKQIDAAIEKLNRAIQANPQHAEAYRYLGLAYGQKNLWQEAGQVLHKAITLKPNDVQSLKNLGVAHLKLGEFGEAIQVLQQALQHAPNDAKAKSYYALATQKQAEQQEQEQEQPPDPALQDFVPPGDDTAPVPQKAAQGQPPKGTRDPVNELLDKGVECLDNGQYNAAIEVFNEVIRLTPTSANGYFGLGMVYEKRGDWGKAIDTYEKVLELNPDDNAGRESLKFARKQKKKFKWKFWKT